MSGIEESGWKFIERSTFIKNYDRKVYILVLSTLSEGYHIGLSSLVQKTRLKRTDRQDFCPLFMLQKCTSAGDATSLHDFSTSISLTMIISWWPRYYMKKGGEIMINKKGGSSNTALWIFLVLIIVGYAFHAGLIGNNGNKSSQPTIVQQMPGKGSSATLGVSFYDVAGTTKTQVYPRVWVLDQNGNYVVNGQNVNSTSAEVGDTLTFYGSDFVNGAAYYLPSPVKVSIDGASPRTSMDVYAAASIASMNTTAYDSDWQQLTRDDSASNSAHFATSLGQSESKVIYYKVSNKQADKVFQVGAVCVIANNNVKSTTLEKYNGVSWKETTVPDSLKNIYVANDTTNTGNDTTADVYKCYVPTSDITLKPWDELKLKTVVTASSNADPTANSYDLTGVIVLDKSWTKGSDGNMYNDFYSHDSNERFDTVGLNETSVFDLTHNNNVVVPDNVVAIVEAQ